MSQLSCILYLSSANGPQSDQALRSILDQSRANNARHEVTGVLCAGGGHYIQVLEGQEHHILKLYLKISEDPRHKDCTLIGIAPLKERLFKDWSMGYIEKSTEAMAARREELLNYLQRQEMGPELVKAMQRFVQMLRESD